MDKNAISYYVVMNSAAFIAFFTDKKFAEHKMGRIPEDILLGLAAAGGAFGGFLSMLIFRHKSKKLRFRLLLPLFIVLHIFILKYFGGIL